MPANSSNKIFNKLNYSPKITIITPSYNQEAYIEKNILSVINQDYPNLEHIIIDGGSTDDSIKIIKRYERHLTYWISEKDKGTYDANNKALKIMSGDYWCIVNSDDYLLPNAISHVVKEIQKFPEEKWLCGGEYMVDENDMILSKRIPKAPRPIEGYTFFHGCWISHPAVFLHADVIKRVGFFRPSHVMDMDYWLSMEKMGYSPHIINEYLAGYRLHKDSKSASKIKLKIEIIKVLRNFCKENNLEKYRRIKSKLIDHEIELYRFQSIKGLIRRDWRYFVSIILKITYKKPSSILTKWYLGTFKRLLFGFAPNDPLLFDFKNYENKANWYEI